MSFTQRAKKKLVSLSKRKTLKNSEKESIRPPNVKESIRPPNVQVPRFPFSEDAQRNLSSSMSLPDQLEQSGATNVSNLSSKSLSSVETSSEGVTLLSYVSDLTGNPRVLNRLHSAPVLSSTPPTDIVRQENVDEREATDDWPCIRPLTAVSQAADANTCQHTSPRDNHSDKSSLLSRLGHSLDFGMYSRHLHEGFDEGDYSLYTTVSPSQVSTTTICSQCQISAVLPSNNNPAGCRSTSEDTDGSQSLEGDLDIYEEDSDDVFKLESAVSVDILPGSDQLKPGCSHSSSISTNNIHACKQHKQSPQQQIVSHQTTEGRGACKPDSGEPKVLLHGDAHAPMVSRGDNSIVKKIRFFEHYNEHRNQPTSNKQFAVHDSRRPAADLHTNTHPNNQALTISDEDSDGGHGSGRVNQATPTHRLFPNPTSARQRLNFSRFKRSDSIPEVVALCSCGDLCQGSCEQGGHDRVLTCQRHREPGGCDRILNCQVCHHPQCTADNDNMPLMLCSVCDLDIHQNHDDHLVLDTRPAYECTEEQYNNSPNTDTDVSDREGTFDVENTRNRQDDLQLVVRNTGENTEITQQELSNTMTLKSESDYYNSLTLTPSDSKCNLLDKLEETNKQRTGSDGEIKAITRWTNAQFNPNENQKSATLGRNPSQDGTQMLALGDWGQDSTEATCPGLNTAASRGKVVANDSYFTLRFADSAVKEDDCVLVAAAKNKILREVLEPVLQARNIDVSSINVFINKSQTPLPMSCDTVFLAGNLLEVKEKESKEQVKTFKKTESKRKLERSSRRDSFGLATEAAYNKQRRGSLQLPFREHFFTRSDSRTEPPKTADDVSGSGRGFHRLTSTHTDEPANPSSATLHSETRKARATKYTKHGSTNKEKERQEQLAEILNRYTLNGLPPFPELLDLGRKKFDDVIFHMESSWELIVDNNQGVSEKQQAAVWELLHTEVSYIKQIGIIIKVFQSCLMNLQLESFLNEVESERVFNNIDKIYECNCLFWLHHLLPILQSSRENRQPLDPLVSKEGFVDHFPILFQVYFKYFIEQKSCLEYARSCMDNNELFRTFVQWAETQKQSNRLRFSEIFVLPMQRLLRYSLLLQAILKHTEKDTDRIDLKAMILSVDTLCRAANNSLRRIEEYKRLEAVRKTLEPFDSIETPSDECAKIIQGFVGNFNLLAPMPGFRDGPRSLLFQSSLRMKEGPNVKMDVDCLLFTDLLLICKSNRKMERFKMIRPPMRLDHLVMNVLKDKNSFMLIYMNEYNVPLSAFAFHSDPGSIRGWVEKFREAQKEFKAKDILKISETDHLHSDTTLTQCDLDDMSVSSALSYTDMITSTISRSESSNSIDHFMPNVLTVHEAIAEINRSDVGHSNSMPNFKNKASSLTIQPHDQNTSADTKLVLSSSTRVSSFTEAADTEFNNGYPDKRKPAHSVSLPETTRIDQHSNLDISIDTIFSEPTYLVTALNESCGFQELAGEDEPSSQTQTPSYRLEPQELAGEDEPSSQTPSYRLESQETMSDHKASAGQDTLNTKLNSRRTEKRYHTADEIPDILNSQKDASIQKWSSLRKDVQLSDLQDLGSTMLSTESFQSYQSSSGVSSNGSLHLTVQISDSNHSPSDADVFLDSYLTKVHYPKQLSVDDSGDVHDTLDFTDSASTRSYLSEPRLHLAESRHAKSKSTSDLVEMFGNSLQVSQMTDGIASVAVTPENFHRKLTHLDILRLKKMKHQILFDANVESSEV